MSNIEAHVQYLRQRIDRIENTIYYIPRWLDVRTNYDKKALHRDQEILKRSQALHKAELEIFEAYL